MQIRRPVTAIGLAGVLAAAAPAALAHATTGMFVYWNVFDGQVALLNPLSNRCLPIRADDVAGPLSNLTDRDAIVYNLPNCAGVAFRVSAHSTTFAPLPQVRSVLFPAV